MIAIYSPNTILYPVVFYGATRAGATVTTVNALYTADELHKQLVDSKAKLLVTISLFLPVATAALGHDPGEPTNLEDVRVRVHPDFEHAIVTYRERGLEVEIPSCTAPPWNVAAGVW